MIWSYKNGKSSPINIVCIYRRLKQCVSDGEMNMLKKLIKSALFWIILIELLSTCVLYFLGFRITYAPNLETCWDAVGATGQWAGALVGILIPIAAIYLQANLDKNKRDIGEANSELYNEVKEFKLEYSEKLKALSSLIDEDGNIVIDGGNFNDKPEEDLKEKALKFINISMVVNTNRVAEHLDISEEEAYDLLVEMLRHDETISSGGQVRKENMNNIIWTKKS